VSRLPTGTVTFLFTDIEGSTRLLEELGDRYSAVLAEHHRLLRDVFQRHGGVEVTTLGDGFFVAFTNASAAVAAAAEAQRKLVGEPVRVRMGLHTGEPSLTEEGYVGWTSIVPPGSAQPATAARSSSPRRPGPCSTGTSTCATSASTGSKTSQRRSGSSSWGATSFRRCGA
jgi:class 3 adenylate cyclase